MIDFCPKCHRWRYWTAQLDRHGAKIFRRIATFGQTGRNTGEGVRAPACPHRVPSIKYIQFPPEATTL